MKKGPTYPAAKLEEGPVGHRHAAQPHARRDVGLGPPAVARALDLRRAELSRVFGVESGPFGWVAPRLGDGGREVAFGGTRAGGGPDQRGGGDDARDEHGGGYERCWPWTNDLTVEGRPWRVECAALKVRSGVSRTDLYCEYMLLVLVGYLFQISAWSRAWSRSVAYWSIPQYSALTPKKNESAKFGPELALSACGTGPSGSDMTRANMSMNLESLATD